MKKARCIKCGWQIEYDIVDEVYTYKEDDLVVKYKCKKAICKKCNNELFVDEIDDYNQEQFEKVYKETNNIITIEEIKNIIEKYSIEASELSIILGFDEQIIDRYLKGYIPTFENSKCLRKMLISPKDYYDILLKNSNLISISSFEKSKQKCEELLEK
jgi:DNA-binding transcriptional regulator YiaG